MKRAIPWTRLGVEGVVIVVSILLAFGLDAWWTGRQTEREVAEDLAFVGQEIMENAEVVGFTAQVSDRVATALLGLVDELGAQQDGRTVAVVDTLVWWALFNNPTLDLSLGGIDALVSSGRLAGIGNPLLRNELASVRGKAGDVVEEQQIARGLVVEQINALIQDTFQGLSHLEDIIASGATPSPIIDTSYRPVPTFGPYLCRTRRDCVTGSTSGPVVSLVPERTRAVPDRLARDRFADQGGTWRDLERRIPGGSRGRQLQITGPLAEGIRREEAEFRVYIVAGS